MRVIAKLEIAVWHRPRYIQNLQHPAVHARALSNLNGSLDFRFVSSPSFVIPFCFFVLFTM